MKRYAFGRLDVFRRTVGILLIPLLIVGVGSALFSTTLTVSGKSKNVAYAQSDNLFFNYSWTTTTQGSNKLYSYNPATVRNNGTAAVSDWRLVVTVPADTASLTCQTTVSCTLSGTTLTIIPQLSIATIGANASVAFTFSYVTSNPAYTLDNISISARAAPTYQTISGLNISFVKGARSGSGNSSSWPYTFTITNNSAQPLRAFRVLANWATGNRVVSMPANITYVTTSTQITMTAAQPLAVGASYQYTASFGPPSGNTFDLTGITVQGLI